MRDRAIEDKQKLFYVVTSLQVGGTEIHLSRIAPRLARRGYGVAVYNLSGLGDLGDTMAQQGVEVIVPPVPVRPSSVLPIRTGLMVASMAKLYSLLLVRRPDIVHFFLPQAYIIGSLLAKAAALRLQVMSRRSLNHYQRRHQLLGRLERGLHRGMSVILANSLKVREQLHNEENVPDEHLALIYNGIDTGPFEASLDSAGKRQTLGLVPGTTVLVVVANLIPYKGHSDLLDAVAGVRERMPSDWRLLAVGRDYGNGSMLADKARSLGIDGHVEFLGPRTDVSEILRISDVGILCSHEEGFSNAILESMAAGLPMVVTDVGGNSEAIVHNDNGLVVPPHDPEALGAAILKLCADRNRATEMGRRGRERVNALFSLDRCVQQYDELYAAIAEGRGLPASLRPDLGLKD